MDVPTPFSRDSSFTAMIDSEHWDTTEVFTFKFCNMKTTVAENTLHRI